VSFDPQKKEVLNWRSLEEELMLLLILKSMKSSLCSPQWSN